MARSKSSKRWLKEHFDDEFGRRSQLEGYRSRAIYKLKEIDEKDKLIKPGMTIIDLCAAPGGKTCHVLELESDIEMVAVELEESRMTRVKENLGRLNLKAELIVADASEASWWDGKQFDRIMVDAPCSSTGVIRRHPDIKSLRWEEDLKSLVIIQQKILQQAWQMLKPGGKLLYVTCSVLRQENEAQITELLSTHKDALELNLIADDGGDWGVAVKYGRQLLPGENDNDGFYFCCLTKLTD